MRFVTGLIVGILLTVGAAYVTDLVRTAPGADPKEARRMVNWDVVNATMQDASTSVQNAWSNLVGHARDAEKQPGGDKAAADR